MPVSPAPSAAPPTAQAAPPAATLPGQALATVPLGGARLQVVDRARGRALLGREDTFTRAWSLFDQQFRLGRADGASPEALLARVAEDASEPEPEQIEAVVEAARALDLKLSAVKLSLPLPEVLHVVVTAGEVEPGEGHTRGETIALAARALREPVTGLLAHELFHVMSRRHATLRDRLYRTIGFRRVGEIALPSPLIRITNPDAPTLEHAIEVRVDGQTLPAALVLHANRPYDGGPIASYFTLHLILLDPARGHAPLLRSGAPVLVKLDAVEGFFEQVGRNTDYLLHPEEILAEHFRLLVMGTEGVPNPELLEAMAAALGDTLSP